MYICTIYYTGAVHLSYWLAIWIESVMCRSDDTHTISLQRRSNPSLSFSSSFSSFFHSHYQKNLIVVEQDLLLFMNLDFVDVWISLWEWRADHLNMCLNIQWALCNLLSEEEGGFCRFNLCDKKETSAWESGNTIPFPFRLTRLICNERCTLVLNWTLRRCPSCHHRGICLNSVT